MAEQKLHTPVEFLKGVGPQRAELLQKELSVQTFDDLLNYFPFRYVDRTVFHKVKDIHNEQNHVQLSGKISNIRTVGANRGRRLVAQFYDDTGAVELVWFKGIRWVKPSLQEGKQYILFGKPNNFKGKVTIPHPELNLYEKAVGLPGGKLQPVYPSSEKLSAKGLNSKGIEKLQQNLLPRLKSSIPETIPGYLLQNLKLMHRETALFNIHFPGDPALLQQARLRLKFEELFYAQMEILQIKNHRNKKLKGAPFNNVGKHFNGFYKEKLPFDLTEAQKKVIREIRNDLGSGRQMNRLLQGDVGSGKTIVALMVMLIALDNDFQTALMAPTEILANQHYQTITEMLEKMGIKTGLLTGSTKAAERKVLHEQLETGEMNILIGTHALLEEKVQFENLGLVVIDEQHRFGVAQRAKLWKKNDRPPHVLVMTATPIPRTLAMTFYGDLDASVIDEMPPGRKQVKTVHHFDSGRLRVFGFMKEQIKKGRQVYVVYPLIQESEKMDYKDLMDGYESICRAFPKPAYQVSIVHGKMKPADKDFEMQRFVNEETQILVATTVIEVGVNVPNASVMVIESAERFGLSQLHQLRGRVGRGADQSFCVLMTGDKLSSDAKLRVETMVRTGDGFQIAETDLKLRGPGDVMGTRQSGLMDFKIADLATDGKILRAARNVAQKVLNRDPDLVDPENILIKKLLKERIKDKGNWSRIS